MPNLLHDQRYHPVPMTFLMPRLNGLGFDSAVVAFVQRLAAVGWASPWKVEFHAYGRGRERWVALSTITGEYHGAPFRLKFGRTAGLVEQDSDYNSTANLEGFTLPPDGVEPGVNATLYCDGSGSMHMFLAPPEEWKARFDEFSRAWWSHGAPAWVKSVDRRERGTSYYGESAEDTNRIRDLERQLVGRAFRFIERLKREVLDVYPEKHVDVNDLFPMPAIPLPEPIKLHGLISEPDARRILAMQHEHLRERDHHQRKCDHHALQQGWRLVNLGVRQEGAPFPEAAHDGFTWASFEPVVESSENDWHYRFSRDIGNHGLPVTFNLRVANDAYVVDYGPEDAMRLRLAEASPNVIRFSDAQVNEFSRVTARTMVPLKDYRGGFARPYVLIGREVQLDEIDITGGIEAVAAYATARHRRI